MRSLTRAYVLTHHDGMCEPCVVVFALSATAAHQQYRQLPGALFSEVSVDRAPMFDGADPQVPVRFYARREAA